MRTSTLTTSFRHLRRRIGPAALPLVLATALSGRAAAQQAAVPTVANAFALTAHEGHDQDLDALLHSFDHRIDFTENRGQFGRDVLFRADFPLGQAVATPTGMVISTFDPASVEARADEGERLEKDIQDGKPFRPLRMPLKGHAWAMDFIDRSPAMKVSGRRPHSDPRNYVSSDARRSASQVSSYQEVWYENVYDKVDVRYYPSAEGTLEYDLVCRPGSRPGDIAIRFTGIDRMALDAKGSLVLHTSVGDVELPAPVVYQRIGGRQRDVEARYEVRGNVLRFRLGAYDREQPLVIDPIALRWATWVNTNSTGDNHGHCIWVDPSDGAIYVVARVVGTTDQITPGAFDTSANGDLEMIVGKYMEPTSIGQSGTRVWQTYIGGNGDDNPYAMEQGPDGNLYITGYTSSTNYPLLGGSAFSGSSIDQRNQSTNNIFITKIDPAGTSIKSAVIGGNGDDGSFDIRIDASGDVLVCGNTRSTNLATLYSGSGASNTNNGNVDVIVFKVNADLSAITWMKNYGGSGVDQATIMLQNNATGDIFVGGYTTSTNFPTTAPRQSTRGGDQAGFLQRLTGAGGITWSSYFQAASNRSASILCMEFNTAKDQLYFGGVTTGLASSNVTGGAYDNSANGNNDLFVAQMGIDQTLIKSTYLGGSSNEVNMMGLNTDQNNDVYVFGYTNSTNFPVSGSPNTPLQTSNQGSNDKTFTKLSSDLTSLLFSTYYGGTQDDYDPVGERGIKFSNCRIYTIVTARSTNLPLTQGALNTSKGSGTGTYEPGLVVWANPPDLLGNTITGNQSVCAGSVPGDITGSVPAYVLPTISRNNSTSTYPSLGSATSYQWQISTDSLSWNDIPGATNQDLSGSLIGAVNEKTYVRRVIGGDACILAGAADQVVTVKLISVSPVVQQVSCNGLADGRITAVCDGVAPFTYAWSNGQDTQTATGLAPGNYSVTVTDANGCTASGTFTMTEPAVLSGSTSTDIATCGNANGGASVTPTGGTAPYTYLWSEGSTSASINGLAGGDYSVTVTDAHGCTVTLNTTVPATSVPNANAGADAVITCSTGASIQLDGSSATPGVGFSWTASNGGHIVSGASSATPTVDAAGTYTLTVLNTQTGCSASDAVVVTKDVAAPNASAAAGGVLTCTTTSVMLDGGSTTPNGSFAWTGPNGFTSNDEDPAVSEPGLYLLTVTAPNGCTSTADTQVQQDIATPNATAQGGSVTCAEPEVMLDGDSTTPNVTFSWSGPNGFTSNDEDPVVSAAGTYTLTVTGGNGCTNTADATVTEDVVTIEASAQGGTITCALPSVTLHGSSSVGDVTYAWTGPNGFTSDEQDPAVNAAGTYELTVTAPNGCMGMASAVVGEDVAIPNANASGDVITCATPVIMLNGGSTTPNVSFAWSGPNGFTSNEEDPMVSAAGAYMLSVTATNGCKNTASATVTLDDEAPGADAIGGTLTCATTSVMLMGTGNGSFAWSGPNGFASNEQNPTVAMAGTYALTVTGDNGCTSQASAEVILDNAVPGAQATGGTLTCATTSVMLMGTGNGSFAWSGPNGFTSSEQNPVVAMAGTYELTVTGDNGCTSQASAEVILDNEVPGAQASGGTLTCATTSVILMGTGNGSFAWSGPNGFASSEQNPVVATAGTYMLTVIGENGCTSEASAEVTMDNDVPGAQAVGGTLTCATISVMLMGSGNGSFAWSGPNGFTSNEQNPIVAMAGTYTLTVTGQNGCTSEASAEVTMDNDVPGAQASGGTLTCATTSVMLMGTGNGSFAWTGPNGFTSNEQNPTVAMAGTYTLTVTGQNGCTSEASAEVTMDNDVPGAQASGGTLTCATTSVTLMGSGNGSFAWTGPNGFTSNEQNPTVAMAGTYTLTVTGQNGCTSEASAEVILDNTVPGAQASGGTLTCATTSVTLMGTGNGSFAWSGPNGFTSNEQNPVVAMAGTYALTVTGQNGCTSEASAEVTMDNDVPGAQAVGGTLTCATTSVMLMGSGNGSFAWSGPNGFTSNEQNPVVNEAGPYTLVVTGQNGCNSQAAAEVTLNVAVPEVDAFGGTLDCAHPSVTLNGYFAPDLASFVWTGPGGFSSTDASPVVMVPGVYTLMVTGPNGCSDQVNTEVMQDLTVPNASATGGTLDCEHPSVMLMGSGNGSFAWTGPNGFASNEQNPTVAMAGTYTLIVTGQNGCTSQAVAEVALDNDVPGAQASGGTLTCATTSVMLMGSGNGSFAWSGPNGFTSNEQNPVVAMAGTYALTVTGQNGCTSEASAEVALDNAMPDASATGGVIDCNHMPLTLNGHSNTAGVSFAWSGPNGFAASTADVDVATPGLYTFTVTATNGCTHQVDVDVTMDATHPDINAEGGVLDCAHPTVMLDGGSASPNVTYLWRDGSGLFSSTEPDPVVDVPGFYTLAVTGENGCTAYLTVAVSADLAAPNATAEGGMIGCNEEGIQLDGGSTTPGATFAWTSVDGFQSTEEDPMVTEPSFYTLTVTGPNGCTATATAVVTKESCTGCDLPLIIACAPDVTVECGTSLDPASIGEPIIRKVLTCPAPNYVSWSDSFSGSCPMILTRTWTVGDESGHFETCVQTVTIEDHTAPTLMNVPQNITVSCGQVPAPADVWAEDACKKTTTTVVLHEQVIESACIGTYKIERTWTSSDECGNTAVATQVITVLDNVAPMLHGVPDAITVECGADIPPADVWAEDGCDPQVEVDYEETLIPGTCPGSYSIVRIWSATDACGNTATASQLVNVVDTQAPVLSCVVEDMTVPCDGIPEPMKCKAMDACAGEVEVTMTEERTGDDCIDGFTITRTYSAVDECGNAVSATQTITVTGIDLPTGVQEVTATHGSVNVWPNPFHNACTLQFTAAHSGKASLQLMDAAGRKVADLFDGQVTGGRTYTVTLDRNGLATGVYLYRLALGDEDLRGRVIAD